MRRLLLFLALLALPCLALPETAPDVTLADLDGKPVALQSLVKDRPVALVWWCSSCPSCRTVDKSLAKLAETSNVYVVCASKGETPEAVRAFQAKEGLQFPVLFDPEWKLTGPLEVKATTTTLVLDDKLAVRYFGRFREDQKAYAREALEQVAQGQPVTTPRTRQYGCTIPKP